MNRIIVPYANEAEWLALRAQDLTSTDIAALFGLSPYKTAFELWHEKKAGERGDFAENDRMKWGKRLEPAVAAGIAADMGWAIRPMKEYIRLDGLRLGSSFDFRVQRGSIPSELPSGNPRSPADSAEDAHLEIKCVDFLVFRDGWVVDEGFIEAPAHIEIQVQHQMLVSGLRRAYIGVMVSGNRIEVIEREADDAVQAGILAKAAEFWRSIDENNPPDPVMPDDAEAVIRMNQYAEPGKFLDARGDAELATLLRDYERLGKDMRQADEDRKVLKAELLQRIGSAEKVAADGFTISAGIVGPTRVEYDREGYRNLRVYAKKAKLAEAAE